MDLESLKASVLSQAEECRTLLNKKSDLEKQLADTVKKNLTEIVMPYIESMNSFCNKLYDLGGGCCSDYRSHTKYFSLGDDIDTDIVKLYCQSYYKGLDVYFTYKCNRYSEDKKLNDMVRCWSNPAVAKYFYWFGTEEKTQEFVEILGTVYADILKAMAESFKTRNEALTKSVMELSDKLLNARSVTHNEDGTVEIHLGDKVYRGTLIED